jgi:excisionase family DNA binding protein
LSATLNSSPPVTPELLTVRQTAELLGVSVRLVWYLANDGTLPPVRIRGCTRWRRTSVVRYLKRLDAEAASRG